MCSVIDLLVPPQGYISDHAWRALLFTFDPSQIFALRLMRNLSPRNMNSRILIFLGLLFAVVLLVSSALVEAETSNDENKRTLV